MSLHTIKSRTAHVYRAQLVKIFLCWRMRSNHEYNTTLSFNGHDKTPIQKNTYYGMVSSYNRSQIHARCSLNNLSIPRSVSGFDVKLAMRYSTFPSTRQCTLNPESPALSACCSPTDAVDVYPKHRQQTSSR